MKRQILLGILLMFFVFIFGCTKHPTPSDIDNFEVSTKDSGNIWMTVSFIDEKDNNIKVSGKITLEIFDGDEKIYSKTWNIKEDEFKEESILGIKFIEYSTMLSKEDFIKNSSSSYVVAKITYEGGGKILTAEDDWAEISDDLVSEDISSSEEILLKIVNKSKTKGLTTVKLQEISLSKEEDYNILCAKITVTNGDNEMLDFQTGGSALIYNGIQYDYSWWYSDDFDNIFPKASKEGKVCFKNTPEKISGDIKIYIMGSYESLENAYVFETSI